MSSDAGWSGADRDCRCWSEFDQIYGGNRPIAAVAHVSEKMQSGTQKRRAKLERNFPSRESNQENQQDDETVIDA